MRIGLMSSSTVGVARAITLVQDFPTRALALSPIWWSRLNHISSPTDHIGTNHPQLANISDLQFQTGGLITDGSGDNSMGFGANGAAAGCFTINPPIAGTPLFWAFFRLQVDTAASTMVLLTIGGGDDVNGEAILKLEPDGAGGLVPRFESFGPSGFAVKQGTIQGTVPVGQSVGILFWRTATDVFVEINGIAVNLGVVQGTFPQTWGNLPSSQWKIGFFGSPSSTISPYNGLMGDVIFGGGTLGAAQRATLVSPPHHVTVARDIELADINEDAAPSSTSAARYVHPETGTTLSIVNQATHGTAGTSGLNLTFDPNAVGGAQDDTFEWRATHANGIAEATASIRVLDVGSVPDLPFFGQYFGSVFRGNVGDTHLDKSAYPGVFCFFRAERTGIVTGLDWYFRYDYAAGTYSKGNGGTYRIEIWPANSSTMLPITTGSPICRINSWSPSVTSGAGQRFVPSLSFNTTGQLIAKQPYALVVINTAASPTANYVSQNTPTQFGFDDDSDPANYIEPGDDVSGAVFPQNVGATIKPVRGWHPAVIDNGAFNMYPFPSIHRGNFRYRRLGTAPMLMALIYSDGRRATYTCWGSENSYALDISGTNQVRERFKVTRASRTVSGVFIRVACRTASGHCVVTLESGPSSVSSGNGSALSPPESISVPASNFLEIAGTLEKWFEPTHTPPIERVHYVWVPFSQNRVLDLGSIYSIRLSASGGFDGYIWSQGRWEDPGGSPTNHGNNFDTYIANRTVGMNAWEDSMGAQVSTNSGSTWANPLRMTQILFKCV